MYWYSDFKSFTKNLFPLKLSEEKPKTPDSENEGRHNPLSANFTKWSNTLILCETVA